MSDISVRRVAEWSFRYLMPFGPFALPISCVLVWMLPSIAMCFDPAMLSWDTVAEEIQATRNLAMFWGVGIAMGMMVPASRLAPGYNKRVPGIVRAFDYVWVLAGVCLVQLAFLMMGTIDAPDLATYYDRASRIWLIDLVPIVYGFVGGIWVIAKERRGGGVQAETASAPA